MNKYIYIVKYGMMFKIINYPYEIEPSALVKLSNRNGANREVLCITLNEHYNLISEYFKDNIEYSIREFNDDMTEYTDYDKSSFCILDDIIIHKNGSITVYMCKKTGDELYQDELLAENEAYNQSLLEIVVKTLL